MKLILLIPFFLIACSTTKDTNLQKEKNSTEQVFMAGPGQGLPGKCYQNLKMGNETAWTECLCAPQVTKRIIKQIQTDLIRLNYQIDEIEIDKVDLGQTTKQAIKDYQIKNKMAYGGIDWATINRLKQDLNE